MICCAAANAKMGEDGAMLPTQKHPFLWTKVEAQTEGNYNLDKAVYWV
jgi:hypothetical protein